MFFLSYGLKKLFKNISIKYLYCLTFVFFFLFKLVVFKNIREVGTFHMFLKTTNFKKINLRQYKYLILIFLHSFFKPLVLNKFLSVI